MQTNDEIYVVLPEDSQFRFKKNLRKQLLNTKHVPAIGSTLHLHKHLVGKTCDFKVIDIVFDVSDYHGDDDLNETPPTLEVLIHVRELS